jgi:hypothetical protein
MNKSISSSGKSTTYHKLPDRVTTPTRLRGSFTRTTRGGSKILYSFHFCIVSLLISLTYFCKILEPACELLYFSVSVPNRESMMMLNNLIGFRDLVMFMFGCKEDEDLLLNGIRPKRVNTTIVSRETVMTRFVIFFK